MKEKKRNENTTKRQNGRVKVFIHKTQCSVKAIHAVADGCLRKSRQKVTSSNFSKKKKKKPTKIGENISNIFE
jgi:hypothetical protein